MIKFIREDWQLQEKLIFLWMTGEKFEITSLLGTGVFKCLILNLGGLCGYAKSPLSCEYSVKFGNKAFQ